jgi:hypothetical protein
MDINFEYISRNWVTDNAGNNPNDMVRVGSDLVQYEPILIIKFLKAMWLEAKGFDSTAARTEFGHMFDSRTGRDEGAPILNAGGNIRGFPYISTRWNLPDTNYGR